MNYLMVKYRSEVKAEPKDHHLKENLTLFVENLPVNEDEKFDEHDFTNHLDLQRFLPELFQITPKDSIKEVVPVKKYSEKFVKVKVALRNAKEALEYSTENPDTRMFTKCWGQSSQMAKEYYENIIKDLEKEIKTEKEQQSHFHHLDKAFIKFNDIEGAKKFYKSQRNAQMFKASYAPHPDNINWSNLHLKRDWIIFRKVLVYCLVAFMSILVSTPQNAGKERKSAFLIKKFYTIYS